MNAIKYLTLSFIILALASGCGTVIRKDVNLQIFAFSADKNDFNISIANIGADPAGAFNVNFVLDEIYLEEPQNKTISIGSLNGKSIVTAETSNTLTSSDGVGGHHAAVYVNVDNTQEAKYYYDGSYEAAYNYARGNESIWVSYIKSTLEAYYSMPVGDSFNMQLLDTLSGGSLGRCTNRTIKGVSTILVQAGVKDMHDGYGTYKYKGLTYSYSSSQEIVCHEYTHAYHRAYVFNNSSVSQYNSIPTWFKEGLAVHTAGQGVNRVRYYVAYFKDLEYSKSNTVTELLSGFYETGTHEAHDYAGDYLAVYYIRDTFGATALKDIVYRTAYGQSVEDAIIASSYTTGVTSYGQFKTLVASYATNYIDAIWDDVSSTAVSALDAYNVIHRRETD